MAFRISEYRDSSFNDVNGSGVWEIDTVVYCDTIADLPNKDDIAHYKLVMGCRAIIINTGDTYILNSSGDWKKDTSGSGGGGGGGGSTITIDDTVSAASENPVQNKAIYNFVVDEISDKADKSTTLSGYGITDATINASTGSVTLGASSITPVQTIKIDGVTQTNVKGVVNLPAYPTVPTVDSSMIADSTNPVQSKVIQSALDEKPGDVTGTYNYSGTVLTNDVFNDLSNNIATNGSHAEGKGTSATGMFSHTEGIGTIVSAEMGGPNPIAGHAEGDRSEVHGYGSHAEGVKTVANEHASHAEGCETEANTQYSHAEGLGTIAGSQHQHVQGKYNVEDISHKYAFIIGNGTSKSARSNAFAIDWVGNIYIGNATTGINITTLSPTSSYSSTGTSPVNGVAVSKALQTLDSEQFGGDGKLIQSVSEADGIISATPIDIASTYSSTGTSPVNGTAISDALGTLYASSAGGDGKYIQSISQTDGKVSAIAQTMDVEPTNNSTKAVTSGGVYASLQTKPTVVTATITPNPSVAFTNFQYSAIVTGDIITINIRAVPANAITTSTSFLLASVASGYRPPYIVAGPCFANNILRQCWVNSEGGVRLRIDEEIPSGSTIVISFSFNHNDDKWIDASPVSSLNSISPNDMKLETAELNSDLMQVESTQQTDDIKDGDSQLLE